MSPATTCAKLRNLRLTIENNCGGLTTDQALLLNDVCQVLDIPPEQTEEIIGPAASELVNRPLPFRLNGRITPRNEAP